MSTEEQWELAFERGRDHGDRWRSFGGGGQSTGRRHRVRRADARGDRAAGGGVALSLLRPPGRWRISASSVSSRRVRVTETSFRQLRDALSGAERRATMADARDAYQPPNAESKLAKGERAASANDSLCWRRWRANRQTDHVQRACRICI